MFVLTIILGVLTLIAILAWRGAKFTTEVPDRESTAYGATKTEVVRGPNRVIGVVALGLTILTLISLAFTTVYTQSVGQAKVIINAGGTVSGQDATAGVGIKAPWQSVSNWDLFSQNLVYAGNKDDGPPSYTGGTVNGYEITSSVARGAQTNIDLTVTYSLDGNKVGDLYTKYRTQERFTKQVIEPKVLDVVRTIPSAYTPVEFRGEKRDEARKKIEESITKVLTPFGIIGVQVNLQSIRFTDTVEESIKAVEVAQQGEAKQQADLRTATVAAQQRVVEAQATADAARIAAQGQADANATLSASLTPQVLQQRYLDALKAGTVFVVPEGSSPLVNIPAAPGQ